MAYKEGVVSDENYVGLFFEKALMPICGFFGRIITKLKTVIPHAT